MTPHPFTHPHTSVATLRKFEGAASAGTQTSRMARQQVIAMAVHAPVRTAVKPFWTKGNCEGGEGGGREEGVERDS